MTCGTYGQWEALSNEVLTHEPKHQSNYNGCADSTDMERRLDDLEKLLGEDVDNHLRTLRQEFADKS